MNNTLDHIAASGAPRTVQPRVTDEKAKAKLQKAAKEFEAMFVNYMLQSMRKSVDKAESEEDGFGADMMQDMFDQELSKHIAASSNLGFGEMLYKKMTGEDLPKHYVTSEISHAMKPMRTKTADRGSSHKPSKSVVEAVGRYDDIINRAAEKYNIDSTLIKAVMASESAGNPKARSSSNAKGLMQLIDSTAAQVGVKNVWDPEQNIHGGAKYLRQMLDKFDGNIKLAVASYNAGPGRVEKEKKIPAIPETQEYVKRVMNYLNTFSLEGE
ncbi:MAG: transglycosylase SLT domain-containing protein [Bacteroidota bacterium]|jgi:Rod binding domain-containing protein